MTIGRTDLRLVLAINEAGTLLGGARKLGVDHSTAFRRLNSLERSLGVRLFDRARDGYAPTAAGEAMIAAAERVNEEMAALELKLAGADLRPSGAVRVTTTDTLVDLLVPLFAAFRARHPEIELEVAVANAFFTLSRRDADVAIRPSAVAPEDLIAHRVATVATAPYAARDGSARRHSRSRERGRSARLVERRRSGRAGSLERSRSERGRSLLTEAWLAPDESLAHLGSARWLERNVPAERIGYRASSLLALQAAARAGMGVAPLPCFIGDRDPALVRVAEPMSEMGASLWVLIHPDLKRTARVRAFVDFMLPELKRLRPLLEGRGEKR